MGSAARSCPNCRCWWNPTRRGSRELQHGPSCACPQKSLAATFPTKPCRHVPESALMAWLQRGNKKLIEYVKQPSLLEPWHAAPVIINASNEEVPDLEVDNKTLPSTTLDWFFIRAVSHATPNAAAIAIICAWTCAFLWVVDNSSTWMDFLVAWLAQPFRNSEHFFAPIQAICGPVHCTFITLYALRSQHEERNCKFPPCIQVR